MKHVSKSWIATHIPDSPEELRVRRLLWVRRPRAAASRLLRGKATAGSERLLPGWRLTAEEVGKFIQCTIEALEAVSESPCQSWI